MTRWTEKRLVELAGFIAPRDDYAPTKGDKHYGVTDPMTSTTCQCARPISQVDDGDYRCLKCGRATKPEEDR